MRGATLGTVAIAAAALLSSVPARANGRFPASNQFVFSATDKNLVVLRTTYGVLPSHDDGKTWSFLCEEALGLPAIVYVDPSIGLTSDNSLVVGGPMGLDVSPDTGCAWHCAGGALAGQVVIDLAVRPDDPSSAVIVTGTPLPLDDAGGGAGQILSQVFETTDNGATWGPIGVPIPPDVLVTTVDVAKSDPARLYVSGTRGYGGARTASLFVSKGKGAAWIEHPLSAGQFDSTTENAVFIGAIDPTNADRVYVRSASLATGGRSRLTVTTDAGQTFSTAHEFTVPPAGLGALGAQMQGFAISPDGARVYIGSQEDGLWVASASDLAFHQASTIHVQCLATRSTDRGDELWACSDAVSGFVAGVSTDDGATFTAKMPLVTSLSGPIACGSDTSLGCSPATGVSQCAASFASFCAGNDNGGCNASPAANGASAPAKSGGGCSAAGATGRPRETAAVLAVLALGATAWRARRSSRRRVR